MDYKTLSDTAEYVAMSLAIIAASGAVYSLFGKGKLATYLNHNSRPKSKENNLEKEVESQ